MSEPAQLISMRVCDLPDPDLGSAQPSCSACGEPVWVALNMQDKVLDVMCIPCFRELSVARETNLKILPEQREHLKHQFGLSDRDLGELLEEIADWIKYG